MCSAQDGMLVATPAPLQKESILGYLLRVSEINGYDSPWSILSIAGVDQAQMDSTTVPIQKLQKILGRDLEELSTLPWSRLPTGEKLPTMFKGNHRLLRHLQLQRPKICPLCIQENGYVEAVWDLKIMLGCPIHRQPLVSVCARCNTSLTWFRPGLIKCKCGQPLEVSSGGNELSDESYALLGVVYRTFYGEGAEVETRFGMPGNELSRLGIVDLLRLFAVVMCQAEPEFGKSGNYSPPVVNALANIFQGWPTGFYGYLKTIDTCHSDACLGAARRFPRLYGAAIAAKKFPKDKMVFIRSAFADYVAATNQIGFVDPRYYTAPRQYQLLREAGATSAEIRMNQYESFGVGSLLRLTDLSMLLGVRRGVAREWYESGKLGCVVLHHKNSRGMIFRVVSEIPRKDIDGAMDVRAAARYLGIPVSTLVQLRKNGYYNLTRFGATFAQYHRQDLADLGELIMGKGEKEVSVISGGMISLREIFRIKGVERKYRVIIGILNGSVTVVGRLGQRIADLVIEKNDFISLAKDIS